MTAIEPMLDVAAIRGDFPVLGRMVRGRPLVYLDSSATSQKPRAMIERITAVYGHDYSRPEEGHVLSQEATRAFEGTRGKVARLINGREAREVVFCRGATEGLNLVSRFIQHDGLGGQEVMLTEAEHHSNIVPWLIATREVGASIRVVPITPEGDLDLAKLERMLSDRVRIVAVSHVSNVTGAVFPVERVTELAHAHGSLVLVDGAQAVPHLPVDVQRIGCDFYVGSGHKMGGPSSVGFLWGKAEVLERMPVADGGSTMAETVTFESFTAKPIPSKYEAGEPPFGEVEAWGPAIDYWTELGMERIAAYEEELTAYAVELLRGIDRVRVLGSPARRISVVSFVVDGMSASDVARQLDEQGIATRAGTLAAQPHLRALGVEEAVRASFAFYNTHEEAVVLAGALRRIVGGR